jgi:hypothetical protein
MKAFEEWIRTKELGIYIRDHTDRAHVKRTYEQGWRAALEWLQDNEDAHCCGDCDAVGDWTECPKDTAIKQELEGK